MEKQHNQDNVNNNQSSDRGRSQRGNSRGDETKVSDVNTRTPAIIGTNVIRFCKDMTNVCDEAWKNAIQNMCVNNCLPVKSTNRFPITLGQNDVKYVKGVVKNISATQQVITEQADNGEPARCACLSQTNSTIIEEHR